MKIRKRFIAGAVCPACQEKDTLALRTLNDIDIIKCVKCSHELSENDKWTREEAHKKEQIIQIVRLAGDEKNIK